jgi:hypothetical protein
VGIEDVDRGAVRGIDELAADEQFVLEIHVVLLVGGGFAGRPWLCY